MKLIQSIRRVLSDEQAGQLWVNSRDTQEFLVQMRAAGASKLESIRALRIAASLDLGEAKRQVHLSPVWEDTRTADDELHDDLIEAVLTLPAARVRTARTGGARPSGIKVRA